MSQTKKWMGGGLAASLALTSAVGLSYFHPGAEAQEVVQQAPSLGGPVLSSQQLARAQRLHGHFVLERGMAPSSLRETVAAAVSGSSMEDRRERTKLEEMLRPPPRMQFAFEVDGTDIPRMTLHESRARASTPLSGEARSAQAVSTSVHGFTFSQQLEGSSLLQVIEGKGVRQERRLTLDAAGRVLNLVVRVTGERLSSRVETRATYIRSDS